MFAHTSILTALDDLLRTAALHHRDTLHIPAQTNAHASPTGHITHTAALAFLHQQPSHPDPDLADTLASLFQQALEQVKEPSPQHLNVVHFNHRLASLIGSTEGAGSTITITWALTKPAQNPGPKFQFDWEHQLPLLGIAPLPEPVA